jgi:hypothetical protein
VVAGYQPIMPTYQGLVTEEQLLQLVAYVRSLKGTEVPPVPARGRTGRRPGERRARHDETGPMTAKQPPNDVQAKHDLEPTPLWRRPTRDAATT